MLQKKQANMLLNDKLRSKNLILASGSSRRRELLHGCGLRFTIAEPYKVEELYPSTLDAEVVPEYLAALKSNAYPWPLDANDLLLTADTDVILDGKVLGKPAGKEEAATMLRCLSGVRHRVVTGVVIRSFARRVSFSAQTDVWFRDLTDEEIAFYVNNYHPCDKAGAYGIQEWIGYVAIHRIEGSFYNVMGLPVQQLYVALNRFIDKT